MIMVQYVYRIFCESLAGTEVTICFAKTEKLAKQIMDIIPTSKMSIEKLYTNISEVNL